MTSKGYHVTGVEGSRVCALVVSPQLFMLWPQPQSAVNMAALTAYMLVVKVKLSMSMTERNAISVLFMRACAYSQKVVYQLLIYWARQLARSVALFT